MKRSCLFTLLVTAITIQSVFSNDADSLKIYDSRDSIVVVANRFSTSLKNLPYNYQTIPRQEIISLSNHSVLEAIDWQSPSAFVMDKKVMGYGVGTAGAGQLNLRGLGGQPNTGVLVLLNGHPDAMAIFGHPLPDVYGNNDVYQAEILPGAASTVFGNHAMGGVVNLVTGPDYAHPLKISAEGGSYHTYRMDLSTAQRWGEHGFFITLSRKKSDGHINQTNFESFHIQAGWQHQLNSTWDISVQGRYVPYQFDDPSRGQTDLLGLNNFGDIRRGMGELIFHNKAKKLSGSTQLYTNLGRHEFYDGFQANDYTYGFSSYQHYALNSQFQLATGLDLMRLEGKAKNDFAFLPNGMPAVNADQQTMNSAGGYAVGFYTPYHFLNLKAGLRYQYNTLSIGTISPMLSATLNIWPQFKAFASYGNGFRTPTLMELYLFPSANPNLENEHINNYESGLEYVWSGTNSARISVFRNDISNVIQAVSNASPPPLATFQNSGQADQWGWEALFNLHLHPFTKLQFSYAYLEPDGLTAYNPRHQFKYMFGIDRHYLGVYLYGKFVQDLFAENNTQSPLPDYHLFNASFRVGDDKFNLYLKFLNILDRDYEVLSGYPAPGRQGRIGFRLSI